MKLEHEEVRVRVLLAGVGQITESDVQLARASDGIIVAFNVRATSQARELAQRDGVDIRYYSIIYDVADDVEKLVRGKVAPKARENFLGYANEGFYEGTIFHRVVSGFAVQGGGYTATITTTSEASR